jgi:hypothetical protein
MEVDEKLSKEISKSFPTPQIEKLYVQPYYILYMPKGVVVTKVDMKCATLIKKRRKKVLEDSFSKHKMCA